MTMPSVWMYVCVRLWSDVLRPRLQAECATADATADAVRSAMEMLGAYRLLAMVYGGVDAARADFYAHAAAECAETVRSLGDGSCPAAHTPSWT